MREARDSDAHPVVIPIIILLDTTGSMGHVPVVIEKSLPKLMGQFLDDKASGKKYLGDAYPAILIAAVDDYSAMHPSDGSLQFGQFESGMEVDQMLENLWITQKGGGTYEESYELGIYAAARHTVHDHMEKRGKKGYMFIIGDEHAYPNVYRDQVKAIIGDTLEGDITLDTILAEAKELYNVFFVLPNMTNQYKDDKLVRWWVDKLGQQNVLRLEDPEKICSLIVSSVAICEQHADLADLVADGVVSGDLATSLVPLSSTPGAGAVDKYSARGLPAMPGKAGSGAERL